MQAWVGKKEFQEFHGFSDGRLDQKVNDLYMSFNTKIAFVYVYGNNNFHRVCAHYS